MLYGWIKSYIHHCINPGDYGIVPRTLSEDQDPLDVLVLMRYSTYPGILLQARPIALLKMKDAKKIDNKILCVAVHDPRYARYKEITDIDEHVLRDYIFLSGLQRARRKEGGDRRIEQCQGSQKDHYGCCPIVCKKFRKYPTKEASRRS
jgi:inorganic pyrophosphatase